MRKILKWIFRGFLFMIFLIVIVYVWTFAPIITGYAAQSICSGIFISGRSAFDIENDELRSFPCFHIPKYIINYSDSSVTATFFGLAAKTAVYRKGLGTTLVNKMSATELRRQRMPLPAPIVAHQDSTAWPQGNMVGDSVVKGIDTAQLSRAVSSTFFHDGEHVSPTRAVVVVYNDQLVFEKYAIGFNASTKQTGWSMAKSISNAMVGILVKQGKLNMSSPAPVAEWQNDERKKITPSNLMQLNSGLSWWGFPAAASSQTEMIFNEDDMAGYALSKPLTDFPGTVFNYSDGSVNILQLIIRRTVGDSIYYRFPYEKLFYKLGMLNTIIAPDANGTFTGSSYVYASARDWARFGMLYLHDGMWSHDRILPEGWVKYSTTQSKAKNVHKGGRYGAGWWVNQRDRNGNAQKIYRRIPDDCFYAQGYDGQYLWVIPSRKLVVVRLAREAFTKLDPDDFLSEIIRALPN